MQLIEIYHTNKNRGTQVVKLCVPFFVFCFRKGRCTRAAFAAQEGRSKPECRTLPKEKESMEWRNRNPLQRVSQPRLDLTNLAVTTGYHSLSCLSSPDLKFFCEKSFFSKNWTLVLRNLSRLCVKSIRSLLLFEKNTDIIFLRLLGVCICLRLAAHSYAPRRPPRSGFSKAH